MHRSTLRSILALTALALISSVKAQAGPGLPNVSYPQNELFTIISTLGSGSHGRALVHDGYLGTLRSGGSLEFWNVSNPYSPALATSITGMGLSEPHTYALTNAYGGTHIVVMRGSGLGGKGLGIWDVTSVHQSSQVMAYDIPGVPGGYATGVFWFFAQGSLNYVPAGSLGLFIVDTSVPSAPVVRNQIPKSALGGFNTVLAFAIGNMLVLANSDSGSGYSLCDISDPLNPVLVHSEPNTPVPYGAKVNGGQFLVPAVSGCAQCTGGNNGSLHVHDIGPTSFPTVVSTGLPSRGASLEVQDDYLHVAASRAYLKYDASTAQLVVLGQTVNPLTSGDFDWVTPIGNLVVLGDDQGGASSLVPHDTQPDTTGPEVTMVVPADGAVNQALTTRIGASFSDMVDLASLDPATFFVRPLGGQPIAGTFSVQLGIVNFVPQAPLATNTTYEVGVPAGGVKDWSGNSTGGFLSVFSTGTTLNQINVAVQSGSPVSLGQGVVFDVASATGPGPLLFSWDFGDGSPATPFSSSSSASHTYLAAGHYSAQVTVSNGTVTGSAARIQTVHYFVPPTQPTRSSTIALQSPQNVIWCVNADNDTVTAIDGQSLQKLLETPVGAHPRTLAIAPNDTAWVVCEDEPAIYVVDAAGGTTGQVLATIPLPHGSGPYGIAMSPDGSHAYVTLRAAGQVARLDLASATLIDTVAVGPEPKGIAITADSQRILVTRFVSTSSGLPPTAEVYELAAASFTAAPSMALALDPGPDTENSGRGLPNYLSSLTISPDGRRVWLPSKKDNIERGMFRDGQPLTFESTVRTIASQIDLVTNLEDLPARIDFNDRDMAFAVEFSPLGDYAFVAMQGSNSVDVRDAYTGDLVAAVDGTGLAPQGLVMSADGQQLFVHNFMSRTVAAYDIGGVTGSTSFEFVPAGTIDTVSNEQLTSEVLLGKQVFYNAADPRMNEDGYLSCATCHLDGEHDGQIWDFTARGEGLRNTVTLIGRGGTGHGRVHWTANFDEIQDFENDIRNAFGGDGFLTQAQWLSGTVSDPLGQQKAGLSPELDALAAYVASLSTFGESPHRLAGGGRTAAADRGEVLFENLGCASCHSGPGYTDSPFGLRHDVGTIGVGSGQALGGPLTGFDTPTLRGLWSTAPYLHNGSAETLMDVIDGSNPLGAHGATNTLTLAEKQDLVAYLLSIDDDDSGCRLPGTNEDLQLLTGVGALPNGNCLEEVAGIELLALRMESQGGAFDSAICGLIYQLHGPGGPPQPTFPGIRLDRIDAVELAIPLTPAGYNTWIPLSPVLSGSILRVQAVALSTAANNGTYAASGAHDVFIR